MLTALSAARQGNTIALRMVLRLVPCVVLVARPSNSGQPAPTSLQKRVRFSNTRRYMKTLLVVVVIVLAVIEYNRPEHRYAVITISTPQSDGSTAHDTARVNLDNGTLCSLHDAFWYQNSFVEPCK